MITMKTGNVLVFCCVAIYSLILSCSSQPIDEKRDVLARVGPFNLHLDEVPPFNGISEDSTDYYEQFVHSWTVDKAFELSAIEDVENREELEEQVEAYRSSLITHLYEKQIVENQLDSNITQAELESYYESNKSQYVLNSSIIRLQFIQLDKDHSRIGELSDLWHRSTVQTSSRDSLIAMANEAASVFILNDSAWYRIDDLSSIIPDQVMKEINRSSFKEKSFSNDTARYFLRVLEQVPDTEVAPLSFIEKQARKVILYQRQQELIRNARRSIYNEAVKRGRIDIINK